MKSQPHLTKLNPKTYYQGLQKTRIACPLCKCEDFDMLHEGDRYNMGIQTVICNNCGLGYTNPQPTEAEMNLFYKNHYRDFYSGGSKTISDYNPKAKVYKRAKDLIQFTSSVLQDSSLNFLDIGCEQGFLLHQAKMYFNNAKLFGVEPNAMFANFAQNRNNATVFSGTIEEFFQHNHNFPKMDVISLNHVLEHIPDPQKLLLNLKAILNSTGYLLIEVPDIQAYHNTNPRLMFHIAHLIHFSKHTLHNLLDLSGFKIVKEGRIGYPWAYTVLCQNKSIEHKSQVVFSGFKDSELKKLKHSLKPQKKSLLKKIMSYWSKARQ